MCSSQLFWGLVCYVVQLSLELKKQTGFRVGPGVDLAGTGACKPFEQRPAPKFQGAGPHSTPQAPAICCRVGSALVAPYTRLFSRPRHLLSCDPFQKAPPPPHSRQASLMSQCITAWLWRNSRPDQAHFKHTGPKTAKLRNCCRST